MRASIFLTFLGLASTVISSPVAKRQTSGLQAINNDVSSVNAAVNVDLTSITSATKASAGDVSAQVELIAEISGNLTDIQTQFEEAATVIASSTVGLATTLTAPEIEGLTITLNVIASLAVTLKVDFESIESELVAATFTAIKSEYAAAVAALSPFVNPLVTYANSVTLIGSGGIGNVLNSLSIAATGAASAVAAVQVAA